MGKPAARQGDGMTGTDMLAVMVPAGTTEIPTPMQRPFNGEISGGLSATVRIEGRPAATVKSTATLTHTPPPGMRFQMKPRDEGTIRSGSTTVRINREFAVRTDDPVLTRNATLEGAADTAATGTVRIG
jgi:uncharacterized Zn-binding protein involved in type VI secretion